MSPIMKSCRLQMTHHVRTAGDVGEARGACENEIDQYEDEDQQSITAKLFDNNETGAGGTLSARELHESAANIPGNHDSVTIARNGKNKSTQAKEKILSGNNHFHSYVPGPSHQYLSPEL